MLRHLSKTLLSVLPIEVFQEKGACSFVMPDAVARHSDLEGDVGFLAGDPGLIKIRFSPLMVLELHTYLTGHQSWIGKFRILIYGLIEMFQGFCPLICPVVRTGLLIVLESPFTLAERSRRQKTQTEKKKGILQGIPRYLWV